VTTGSATKRVQAGVTIRELTDIAELEPVSELFRELWREPSGETPMSAHLLRALRLSGNYVAGAFDPSDRLVAASAGWASPPPRPELHSHITGVAKGLQGGGIGRALKLHQREWAAAHGLSSVTWTFDPLVRRNAAFNLRTLGARVEAYLENVYGEMEDELNAGGESDRLFVRWEVEPGERAPTVGQRRSLLVATPADIEALRRTDPAEAARWRERVRSAIQPLLASGGRVTGFTEVGEYVVEEAA
jgi:predicted GNAT superfamily acetyltransferase